MYNKMEYRKCSLCKLELELSPINFHKNKREIGGYDYRCKPCKLTYYKKNSIKMIEDSKRWKEQNPLGVKLHSSKYRQSEKGVATRIQYRKTEYDQKYGVDMEWTILRNMRIRFRNALTKGFKTGKTIELLGCNIKEYIIYLEQQFDGGMNWGNYGKYWEIDHIHPLSKGGSFHYTNTQPLSISENRSKGNKI
jgi:hypothetical protein